MCVSVCVCKQENYCLQLHKYPPARPRDTFPKVDQTKQKFGTILGVKTTLTRIEDLGEMYERIK